MGAAWCEARGAVMINVRWPPLSMRDGQVHRGRLRRASWRQTRQYATIWQHEPPTMGKTK